VARHLLVVAGDHLHRHAAGGQRPQRRAGAGLGRIEEGGEAGQHQLALVVHHGVDQGAGLALPGNGQHAKALAPQAVEQRLHLRARRVVKGFQLAAGAGGARAALIFILSAQAQHVFGRALEHQQALAGALDQHRHAPALEVERHLVDLGPGADIGVLVRQDGLVHRALQAAFEETVEVGQLQHVRAVATLGVDVALQPDARLGQGARLVGAQHVHGAHVLDGRQALDDHLGARHAQRPARQRDRHHHRQQLGRQAHGQRHGEHEGLQQRALKRQVHPQREQHQQQREAHDQQAEAPRAGLEGSGWRWFFQAAGDAPDGGAPCGAPHQRARRAADHRAAAKQRAGRIRVPVAALGQRIGGGAALDRVGLAGQQRLVDEEVLRPQQLAVGRDQVAGRQQHHVARHQRVGCHLLLAVVTPDAHALRHLPRKLLGGLAGAALLREVEDDRQRHDGGDDAGAGGVAGRCRDGAGRQQQQHQRVGEAAQELAPDGLAVRLQCIRAEARQAFGGLKAAQAGKGVVVHGWGRWRCAARPRAAPGRRVVGHIKIDSCWRFPGGRCGRKTALLANDGDGLQDTALKGGLLETANLRTQRTQRFRRGRSKQEDRSVFLASSANPWRPRRCGTDRVPHHHSRV